MKYLNGTSNKKIPSTNVHNQDKASRMRERQKTFFDTLGNDWCCSLAEFQSYVQSGEPSDLSVFNGSESRSSPRAYNAQDGDGLTQKEMENIQNAHFDRLYKEYEDEHNYFSKYNDLSEAKEREYVDEDSDEELNPR